MALLPFQVDFDITLQCNYGCKHCNVDAGDRLEDEMTTEQIIDVLRQLHEIGVCDLSITGGEPLLRKDVFTILKHASAYKGFNRLILNTNGLLVTDDVITFIKSECPNLLVVISLDGYDPQTYSVLRRARRRPNKILEREFQRVVTNVQKLVQNGLKVSVNYTVTKTTLPNLDSTYRFVRSLGVNHLLMIKFFPYGAGRRYVDELELPYMHWANLLVNMTEKKLKDSFYKGLQISTLCPWEIYLPLIERGYDEETIEQVWDYNTPLKSELYRQNRDLGCHAGVTSCAISPNGDVYPCGTISSKFPPFVCGNLQKQSFMDIWENSPVLRAFRALDLDDLEGTCTTCWAKELCGGGCRARSYVQYGDLRAIDYLCPIQTTYKQERTQETWEREILHFLDAGLPVASRAAAK